MADIAFIGLGTMGLSMAKNVMAGGYEVIGFDTSSDAIQAHRDNGGVGAQTAAQAAADAKIVFTMLPNGDVVRSALFDAGGVVESAAAGTLVIDMSTIHPLQTDEIRKDLIAKGLSMVDAPVGRTSDDAKAGTSLFMVGGDAADLERARPVLECMSNAIVDCGGPGMGSRMKIVNNLMSTTLNALTAEVLTFSESVGLDRDLAVEVMGGTPAGRGHMSTTYDAKVFKDDISPAFMIDLARKDLKIALSVAEDINVPLTLSAKADEIYSAAQEQGRGAQDWTALYAMQREKFC